MAVALQIGAGLLAVLASALLLWVHWRKVGREDPGSVSRGYRREKGWWPR